LKKKKLETQKRPTNARRDRKGVRAGFLENNGPLDKKKRHRKGDVKKGRGGGVGEKLLAVKHGQYPGGRTQKERMNERGETDGPRLSHHHWPCWAPRGEKYGDEKKEKGGGSQKTMKGS